MRVIILGLRALDGKNKSVRSQSRARKFGLGYLTDGMICFVTSVVCFFLPVSYPHTNVNKLYFLLGDSAMFQEDDKDIRIFFEKRYNSIDRIRRKFPETYKATISWLGDEVFSRPGRQAKTVRQIEQEEFEDQFAQDMAEAQARRRQGVQPSS